MALQRIDYEDIIGFPKFYRTHFINSLSGFKSVNLVGTQDENGITNLSIISSVIHIGANPPLIGFIMRPASVPRHTYENILATNYYTINHISAEFIDQAHQTSARYPKGVSEFEKVGLSPLYSSLIPAPYVAESHLRIGVEFKEQHKIQLNGTIMMIGQIKEVFFPEDCLLEDGFLDIEKAGTVTCSGLDSYHQTQKLSRLSYAKPNQSVQTI